MLIKSMVLVKALLGEGTCKAWTLQRERLITRSKILVTRELESVSKDNAEVIISGSIAFKGVAKLLQNS
jgi:hypothetical protein